MKELHTPQGYDPVTITSLVIGKPWNAHAHQSWTIVWWRHLTRTTRMLWGNLQSGRSVEKIVENRTTSRKSVVRVKFQAPSSPIQCWTKSSSQEQHCMGEGGCGWRFWLVVYRHLSWIYMFYEFSRGLVPDCSCCFLWCRIACAWRSEMHSGSCNQITPSWSCPIFKIFPKQFSPELMTPTLPLTNTEWAFKIP